ncbi:hypothetical protein NST39_10600 [Bacillus sp. FSL W8-0645]|uniref:hypothetical protein n=1 Tax=Bacillus TaxID=1386 RepID=UPI0011A9CF03|nr:MULTISPECIES: hypothetical protein [Bacillus]MBU8727806.1 hypothetical protein [Bacillus pumilus]MCP1149456.1 hypothetical protein [Bacillus sp. 1735sda2]
MKLLSIGDILEDFHGNTSMGLYLVAKLYFGEMFGYKYALVSLNGEGVANGFHDSLQELQDHPYLKSMVHVKGLEVAE